MSYSFFINYKYTSGNAADSEEKIADIFLKPLRHACGYRIIETDGVGVKDIVTIKANMIERIASGIFSATLLLPFTLTGIALNNASISNKNIYSKLNTNLGSVIIKKANTNYDNLELKFWEDHFKDQDMIDFLQMVLINGKDVNQMAEFIVNHYVKKEKIIINQVEYETLIKSVKTQFCIKLHHLKRNKTSIYPYNGQNLHVFETFGDGSCGLHALLGNPVNGSFYSNPKRTRKQFCDWIKERFDQENLPETIQNVLEDYFLNFEQAPEGFRNEVQVLYEDLRYNYDDMNNDQKDLVKQLFISNEDILKAYLRHLGKVSTYLLQDELIAAAECFNRNIVLYQPGWGEDRSISQQYINVGSNITVGIWYNGRNHYERAELISHNLSDNLD